MKSMTGYGTSEGVVEGFELFCELKTLNSKYLDTNVRLPKELSVFEVPLISMLKSKFSRGNIYLNVLIKNYRYKERWPFTIDSKKAALYTELLRKLKYALKLKGKISIDIFTNSPEFFLKDDKPVSDSAVNDLLNIVEGAVKKAISLRETEGDAIKKELNVIADNLQTIVSNIEGTIPSIVEQYKQKLKEIINTIQAGVMPGFESIIGNYIDKIDINEEVKRILIHIKALSNLFETKGSIGKKLEFYTQELIREFNTIASKSSSADITTNVIEAKNFVERIKELSQNIE